MTGQTVRRTLAPWPDGTGGQDTLHDALSEAALEPDGAPGAVVVLQAFGSFGANFHPHLHVLVTDGVLTKDGRFYPVIWPEEGEPEERFRRRFLLLRNARAAGGAVDVSVAVVVVTPA